ncbi:hypothetical protein V500_00474 [Pseudogymnoascus sp. VKM F-4518 (FW-2643)]|nr:hypothetical protein V500_00474 [Pseudogymnoascus sp. VKM F-4518 (FW-2643)]
MYHDQRKGGEIDDIVGPRKKPRKQRPYYSCNECRRLKMKCDGRRDPGQTQQSRRSGEQTRATNSDLEHQYMHDGQHNDQSTQRQLRKRRNEVRPSSPSRRSRTSLDINSPRLASAIETGIGVPICNVLDEASASNDPVLQSVDDAQQSGSHGTLMLSQGGRSKYLGPTAGSEWLKDSETQDISETPSITRVPSPEVDTGLAGQRSHSTFNTGPISFPFNASPAHMSTRELLSQLPEKEEAWTLVESYYRYCAWHHDVAPKASFQNIFDRVYTPLDEQPTPYSVNAQEIALVFIIIAQGAMFNIEMANDDSSVEEWLQLSERALVKGDFLSNNTVAGLQTLHLMAHLHLQLDKGRRGDNAWPVWGLATRLAQAMGMHRDGARWNLPREVVEERRKVFWEINAADTFQAYCFSRPCAINPEHCDTLFPTEAPTANGEKSYSILRFELSQISSEILNMAMRVRKPAFSSVVELDVKLCNFERNLPHYIRCRAALMAMPSRYPQFEKAIDESPEPSRRSITISFQQTNLALNISETIINLHRPYYAKALYDDIDNYARSAYASSFFTVIERCAIIIAIVTDIHARFPVVSARQWNLWYHVFGSALCLGTLILRDPSSEMAPFVLTQIDAAIVLFSSLLAHGARTPRYQRNLQWLSKLRSRVIARVSSASQTRQTSSQAAGNVEAQASDKSDSEDAELVGWRTRLIERVGQNRQTSTTVRHAATLSSTEHLSPNASNIIHPTTYFSLQTPDSMNDLLHDFWDPMLLHDIFEAPGDQANPLLGNGHTWWEDPGIAHDASLPQT